MLSLVLALAVHGDIEVAERMIERRLTLYRRELGELSPKSIVASPSGAVFAQNMIYNHSVTVFDREGNRVADISDRVSRELLGLDGKGFVRGAPVEAAVSTDGASLFVSNYYLLGKGFPGNVTDECTLKKPPPSYVFEIDIARREVVRGFEVGPAPKFLAVTHDGKRLLVSNWCGHSLSIIDLTGQAPTKHLRVASFPRGIAIEPDDSMAYVASMGRNQIDVVDLTTLEVVRSFKPGRGPRHLVLARDGRLFVSLSHESSVIALDKATGDIAARVRVGKDPRSMALSTDGSALYVANYDEAALAVVDTATMKVVQKIATGPAPIGVTFEPNEQRVWVSCYQGSVRLYDSRGAVPHKSTRYVRDEAKRFPR